MITEHQINECNEGITIDVMDPDNPMGPSFYSLSWSPRGGVTEHQPLGFQNGPIAEVGTNGITHEALIAVILDRMRHFQAGKYACEENARAIAHLEEAMTALHERTFKRMVRGVEGTHTP